VQLVAVRGDGRAPCRAVVDVASEGDEGLQRLDALGIFSFDAGVLHILEDDVSLVFINGGNRHVAILRVEMAIRQPSNDSIARGTECTESLGDASVWQRVMFLPMDPIIVKANEVALTKVKGKIDSRELPLTPDNKKLEPAVQFPVVACLFFTMSTPSKSDIRANVIARTWNVSFDQLRQSLIVDYPASDREKEKPIKLFHQCGSFLSE
jgi:hypothetical protein